MATELVVKKWGNSLAAIFPKEFVKKENIKEDEKILIERVKPANIKHLFGSLPRKMTGQEFKNMVRKGWK